MKKHIILITLIVFGLCGYAQSVFALPLTQVSDTMTRLRTDTPADHEIQFTVINGVGLPGKGDTILINFGDAVSSTNSISYEDISLRYGTLGQELSQALYTISGPNVWGASVNTQRKLLTLTFPTSNGTPITTSQRVIIKIGTNVRSNANQLINGSMSGSHVIEILAGNYDSKQVAIVLLQNDAVGAGGPVAEQPPPQSNMVILPLSAPAVATPQAPAPVEVQPSQPAQAPAIKQPTPIAKAPAPAPAEVQPSQPAQAPVEQPVAAEAPAVTTPQAPAPAPAEIQPSQPTQAPALAPTPTIVVVSLGAPANVRIQADKVSSASVVNTDASGQITGIFAEIEENTVAEDGRVSIESISLTQVSNVDSEIRIPSGKDVPDKVFYKINISTKVEKPIRITIKYNPDFLAGLDPSSLKINYWDGEQGKWIPLEDTVIDKEQHTLSAHVIPQTIFAAFATITSREALRQREQVILKSSVKFIPRSSGISQTDLAFTGKTDSEPVRFVNYDFYTSGAQEMKLCIKEKLFLRSVASVLLEFMNKQQKLFYNKTFKCFGGFITSPIEEGTYPMKLKVIYKDDYSESISPNLVVTTPLQAFVKPIMRWIIEDVQSSPLATAGVYGSLTLLALGIWFGIARRVRKFRSMPLLSLSKK
ncbi:hypothetical protein HYW94_00255 [Candidatus Uhrbacteria bacterium]|nr:hypothetical protein [Candidatus Uhrbacteria bacterium]